MIHVVRLAVVPTLALTIGCAPRTVARPGEHVHARVGDSRIQGRLVAAGRDSVEVDWAGGRAAFSRGDLDRLVVRRHHPTGWRVVLGALAGIGAAILAEELASADRHWHADELLLISVQGYLVGSNAYSALQDSVWVRARLPRAP